MKDILEGIKSEQDSLTCEIEELKSRIKFLKQPKRSKQSSIEKSVVKEDSDAQVEACQSPEPTESSSTNDALLNKVDDILAKASIVLSGKDIPIPQVKGKIRPKLQTVKNDKVKVNASKFRSSSSSKQSNLCNQKANNDSQAEALTSNGYPKNIGCQKQLQAKYRRLFRALDQTLSCQNSVHSHSIFEVYDALKTDETFQEFPEMNCIHKILKHLLESYIMPGNFSSENIRLIIQKTDGQFNCLIKDLHSLKNISVARSLLNSALHSKSFTSKPVSNKLQVISFSNKQQITKCLLSCGKIVYAKSYLQWLEIFYSIISSKSYELTGFQLIQLIEYVLSEKPYISPVLLQ